MVRGSLEEEIWETPIMCLEELFFFNFSMSTRNLSAQGVGEGRGKGEDFFFNRRNAKNERVTSQLLSSEARFASIRVTLLS